MDSWKCVLPFPPSINRLYENARRTTAQGKVYNAKMLSAEGVRFRELVGAAVRRGHRAPPRLAGRLALLVYLLPPDRMADGRRNSNRRDVGNVDKALEDALTKAGVILDDSQFDDVRILRGPKTQGGACLVAISAFDPAGAAADAGAVFGSELEGLRSLDHGELPF